MATVSAYITKIEFLFLIPVEFKRAAHTLRWCGKLHVYIHMCIWGTGEKIKSDENHHYQTIWRTRAGKGANGNKQLKVLMNWWGLEARPVVKATMGWVLLYIWSALTNPWLLYNSSNWSTLPCCLQYPQFPPQCLEYNRHVTITQ